MLENAICVEGLEKYFPPALSGWRALLQPIVRPSECALAGVSFAVGSGEAVALVGPKERIRDQLARWKASPIKTMLIGTSQPEALRTLAELV